MDTPTRINSVSPGSQRLVRALWLLLPLAVAATFLVQLSTSGPYRTDVSMFLTGARILTSGQGANLYDLALETEVQASIDPLAISTYGLLPFNYPPYVAMFFAPFAQLGTPELYYLWVASQCVVLVGLCVWISSYFRKRHGFVPTPVIATLFSFAPVYYVLARGQMSLLMLGLWWWAFVSYRHEKWGQLGVAVALAAFKPQMAVFLLVPLIAQKRWRALGYAAAIQAALWGASILLVGPGIVQSYLGMLQLSSSTFGTLGFYSDQMMNFRGLLTIIDLSPELNMQLALVFWVLSIGVAFWVWRRPWPVTVRFGITAVLAVLFSPHLYSYDTSLLLLTATCVSLAYLERQRLPDYSLLLVALGVVFVAPYLSLVVTTKGLYPQMVSIWLFSLLVVGMLVSAERIPRSPLVEVEHRP